MFCPRCGNHASDDSEFCPVCGERFENEEEIVTDFQHAKSIDYVTHPPINDENYYDDGYNNGYANNYQQPGGNYPMSGKFCNKWVAFLLCFFFGVFGVHRFYEGKIGSGILYACTFGLFGIGYFIDLILLLCKPTNYYVGSKKNMGFDINTAYNQGYINGQQSYNNNSIFGPGFNPRNKVIVTRTNSVRNSVNTRYTSSYSNGGRYGGGNTYTNYNTNAYGRNGGYNEDYREETGYNNSQRGAAQNFQQAKVDFREAGQSTYSNSSYSGNGSGSGFGQTSQGVGTDKWYVAFDGKSSGPYDYELFKQMIDKGIIEAKTLVWKSGMDGWQPAAETNELRNLFKVTMAYGEPPRVPR